MSAITHIQLVRLVLKIAPCVDSDWVVSKTCPSKAVNSFHLPAVMNGAYNDFIYNGSFWEYTWHHLKCTELMCTIFALRWHYGDSRLKYNFSSLILYSYSLLTSISHVLVGLCCSTTTITLDLSNNVISMIKNDAWRGEYNYMNSFSIQCVIRFQYI